jgi:hypothetical protein
MMSRACYQDGSLIGTVGAMLATTPSVRSADAAPKSADGSDPTSDAADRAVVGQGLLTLADELERRASAVSTAPAAAREATRPGRTVRPSETSVVGPVQIGATLVVIVVFIVGLAMAFGSDDVGRTAAAPENTDLTDLAYLLGGEQVGDVLQGEPGPGDEGSTSGEGEPSEASGPGAGESGDEVEFDDEQANVGAASDDERATAGDTADGLACTAAALEGALDGQIDGRPVEPIDQRCAGEFGLAAYRLSDSPGESAVYVAFASAGNSWDARHFARTLDCAGIQAALEGFPSSLCAPLG